uniref:Potassium channel domain-containing protein n=1 Tax=Clastoptera arizonana TaxID=38151 RepID=A0A1B6CX02_9HEMI
MLYVRYFDEAERELAMLGGGGRNAAHKRQLQNTRLLTTRERHGGGSRNSSRRQTQNSRYTDSTGDRDNIEEIHNSNAPPILFNKYALEEEDDLRLHTGRTHSHRSHNRMVRGQSAAPDLAIEGQRACATASLTDIGSLKHHSGKQYLTVEAPPNIQLTPTYHRPTSLKHYPGRRPLDYPMNPSPRIMSPLGYTVHRQTYPRLDYMDDYYDYDEDTSNQIKPVPIWLCVFLVISYIIGGAFLFSGWEEWSFPDSAYFCFITLTTIGFGDFVPAKRVNKTNSEVSIALCSLYLLFGIALLAMSFNLVQEEVISNVKSIARHLGIIKDEDEDDD